MRKTFSAIAAASIFSVVSTSAALTKADEIPTKMVCSNGQETVTLQESSQPDIFAPTGESGTVVLRMDPAVYEKMFRPHLSMAPGAPQPDGFSLIGIGELSAEIKNEVNAVTLRTSKDNFDNIISGYLREWNCGADGDQAARRPQPKPEVR